MRVFNVIVLVLMAFVGMSCEESQEVSGPADVVITVNDGQRYQEIDGFGASMTDSSAWLFEYAMNAKQRQAALVELFDAEKGIGLTYLRQPMGTSDFRVSSEMGGFDDYTYDDVPDGESDYELKRFSIAKDEKYIIPVLQDVVAISGDVKFMGSPWSAPHWMKVGNALGGGKLKDDVYGTYALYFAKYIEAYDAHGIKLDAITLQNEPWYEPGKYHGTKMDPPDQIKFVKEMGPLFAAKGIDTEILVWDHNWDQPQYPLEILGDAEAKKYIAGTAWHHYNGKPTAQTQVHDAHPDKDTHFTEGSNGSWQKPGFEGNFVRTTSEMIAVMRNWSKSFITWNLALDEKNGPKIAGGCNTCYGVITINQSSGEVSRRPQYYTFGHCSKFVRPGAYRVDSNDTGEAKVANIAFVNSDGSLVAIALNKDRSAHSMDVNWKGKTFRYVLPARSAVTFKWKGNASGAVEVWLTTGDKGKLLNREADVSFSN